MIRGQDGLLGKPLQAAEPAELPRKTTEIGDFSSRDVTVGRRQPTPSAFNFRCNAERSMPTNSAVREILPEKRLIWAIR